MIRKGLAVKNAVDEAIDQCSVVSNLRDYIEEARTRAEEATDEQQRRIYAARGLSFNQFILWICFLTVDRPAKSEAVL